MGKGTAMTLERRKAANGSYYPVLVVCPACGFEMYDVSGPVRRNHISSHDPEEFGL